LAIINLKSNMQGKENGSVFLVSGMYNQSQELFKISSSALKKKFKML